MFARTRSNALKEGFKYGHMSGLEINSKMN
jgi:hypothetical protein